MIRMTCECVDADELPHRYLRGEMSEDEQAAFERHYFDCPRCFEALEGSWALQSALGTSAARRAERGVSRTWTWGAAAATLAACIAGVAVYRQFTPAPQGPAGAVTRQERTTAPAAAPETPAVDLPALARIDPPPYVSLRVRADGDSFEAAMEHYTRRDFGAAARALRRLAADRPRAANIHFFLGVSELMSGRTDQGIAALQTAAASGMPQLAEHAQFLLAKAWLAKANVPEARRALEACIRLEGAHRPAATDLLGKL